MLDLSVAVNALPGVGSNWRTWQLQQCGKWVRHSPLDVRGRVTGVCLPFAKVLGHSSLGDDPPIRKPCHGGFKGQACEGELA